MGETQRTGVLVIGGGQTGLATSHHLARAGIDHLVVDERERVGDVWRSRWASLRLYSPAFADGLPGHRFPASRSSYPTAAAMADYLEAYAAADRLPVRTGVHVDRVRRRPDGRAGFLVEAGDDRFEADQVVVATGGFHRPHVPELAARLDPSIRQLHSSAYRDPAQLQPGPVLVVGASHSGADLAVEAARDHPTILSGRIHGELPVPLESRRAKLVYPFLLLLARHVLTLGTPIGRRMAPQVRTGGGPLLRVRRRDLSAAGVEWTEARTVDVRDGRPVLADGRVLDVTNVLWCTGFRPDYAWVEPAPLDGDGWPIQRRGVVESVPGLYVLGIPFLYAFASMLVAGAGRDAAYVARHVAAHAKVVDRTLDPRSEPVGRLARP